MKGMIPRVPRYFRDLLKGLWKSRFSLVLRNKESHRSAHGKIGEAAMAVKGLDGDPIQPDLERKVHQKINESQKLSPLKSVAAPPMPSRGIGMMKMDPCQHQRVQVICVALAIKGLAKVERLLPCPEQDSNRPTGAADIWLTPACS